MTSNTELHRLMARRQDYQPSHVLHLLLSVITVGLWIPVWLLVGVSHANERAKIDRKLHAMLSGRRRIPEERADSIWCLLAEHDERKGKQ